MLLDLVVVFETVFFGFTVLASFLAADAAVLRLLDDDRLLAVEAVFFAAVALEADLVVVVVVVEADLERAVLAELDLLVSLAAGDFEVLAGFLALRVTLLLRRSTGFFSVGVVICFFAGAVASSDCFLAFDDLEKTKITDEYVGLLAGILGGKGVAFRTIYDHTLRCA